MKNQSEEKPKPKRFCPQRFARNSRIKNKQAINDPPLDSSDSLLAFKCHCLRKPGRGHGSGSTDFFHLSPVFYFHSDRMKGNVLIYHRRLVCEIRPPPLKTGRQGPEIRAIQTRNIGDA